MSESAQYNDHLEQLDQALADSLEIAARSGLGLDGVLFHAGSAQVYHADDQEIVFRTTPHFRRWLPSLEGPDHVVLARPGQRATVVRVRPRDYWYDTSPAPSSYWEQAVDFEEVESLDQIADVLGGLDRIAYVGSSSSAASALGIGEERVEPDALMAPLDWHRAVKTHFEVTRIEIAVQKAAAGHLAGKRAFEAGGSEREVHWEYLRASDQMEREVPFETIVAFDSKAAILHYQHKRASESAPGKVLLLDAGAGWQGYAADLTRTWCALGIDEKFQSLVRGVDCLEQKLVAMVRPDLPYLDIHLATHRGVAEILSELGVFRVSAEEAFDRGLTHAFMPHGVGHHLGIQVHDVGGHQTAPDGGTTPPPEDHPYLRNTRKLEPGHMVTIEPGIYFVPMLLDPMRTGEAAGAIDWQIVDRLAPFGGVRIEDDVLCTDEGFRDLSRPLLPGPA